MDPNSVEFSSILSHYARTGKNRALLNTVVESAAKYGSDPTLLFWKGFALAGEGNTSEAVSEFERVMRSPGMEFAAWVGLSFALEKEGGSAASGDRMEECKAHMVVDLESASEEALICASQLALWTNQLNVAKDWIKKLRKSFPGYAGFMILRGWWEILSGQTKADFFSDNQSLAGASRLDVAIVKAKYFTLKRAYKEAVEVYNDIVVSFPAYKPALLEKAWIYVAMLDWSLAVETAQRCLAADRDNVEALVIVACGTLAVDAGYSDAAAQTKAILDTVKRVEPRNASMLLSAASSISRLAGKHRDVLSATLKLLDAAAKLDPRSAAVMVETGHEKLLAGDAAGAQAAFERASRLDEASAEALFGIIRCQIATDNLDDAEQQLEFQSQISAGDRNPLVTFMTAELKAKRREERKVIVSLLDEAVAAHRKGSSAAPAEATLVARDPEFYLDAARLYASLVSLDPGDLNDATAAVLNKTADALSTALAVAPASIPALLLLGRCRYALGQKDAGLKLINQCTTLDSSNPETHITLAQIYVSQGNTTLAQSSLEQALAFDFAVRELPLYNLIRAVALEEAGNLSEALKVLEHAMRSPGVRQAARTEQVAKSKYAQVPLSVRVGIFVRLAHLHAKMGANIEANKVISDAVEEFKGTAEEQRVSIAACEVAIERGDVDAALVTLRKVPGDDPYYIKAKQSIAKICLVHKGDRAAYAQTYDELARAVPSVANFTMAAEAMMQISEPEQAMRYYEAAIKLSPKDSALASKIGRVLVTTHDYRKALDYYEKGCSADPSNFVLKRDLAELYLRLKRYDEAQRLLVESLKARKDTDDITTAATEVDLLCLLSDVTLATGKTTVAGELLQKASAKHSQVIARARSEKPEIVDSLRKVAANLAIRIAEFQTRHRSAAASASASAAGGGAGGAGAGGATAPAAAVEEAVKSYQEALRYNEGNSTALLALARLALDSNNLDSCQEHCLNLLRADPGDEEATMMLADVMFRRNDHTTATYHFEQLLERKPNNYIALSRLLVLLRRAGRLEDTGARLLSQAEASSGRASADPGFHFCKGIMLRYSSEPLGALRELNQARKDAEWGNRAIREMVEIYLNTDETDLWEDSLGDGAAAGASQAADGDMRIDLQDRVASAEKLLHDDTDKTSVMHQWLRGQLLMATKNARSIDGAMDLFTSMVAEDRDCVPALLGLAIASQMKKDTSKARNYLKRLAKMDFDYTYANEMEKAYILLAELYIEGGKLDQALALVKAALSHNASCAKAWELQGKIQEKDLAYKDAAESYENAWRLQRERSPHIGYKLAFNFLKANRYVDAITVVHKVLKIDPKYPKIKKDILEKARSLIRV